MNNRFPTLPPSGTDEELRMYLLIDKAESKCQI